GSVAVVHAAQHHAARIARREIPGGAVYKTRILRQSPEFDAKVLRWRDVTDSPHGGLARVTVHTKIPEPDALSAGPATGAQRPSGAVVYQERIYLPAAVRMIGEGRTKGPAIAAGIIDGLGAVEMPP